MFRLPSFANLVGLFWRSRAVTSALSEVDAVSARLTDAVKHHKDREKAAERRRLDCIRIAAGFAAERDTHNHSARRAERVGDRLQTLLA